MQRILLKIWPILRQESRENVIGTCLTIAWKLMDPTTTVEQTKIGVRETSKFICQLIAEQQIGIMRTVEEKGN